MMAKGDEQLGKLVEMENMAAGMMPAAAPFSDVLDHGGTVGIFSHDRFDDEPRNSTSLGGFLELLGLSPSSLLDFSLPPPLPRTPPSTEIQLPLPAVSAASDAATFPVTPNSSSISASCNTEATGANDGDQPRSAVTTDTEASGDEKEKEEEQEKPNQTSAEEEEKKKKKKKGQKRQREPRFAFVTKSDVDHLDDGYRWRKYGQKPLKNSPFPRSYYRCTTAACGVKKRVERSSSDAMVVVTTYEGQHTHPCPVSRGGGAGHNYAPSGFGSGGAPPLMPPPAVSTSPLLGTSHHYRQQQPQQQLPLHGGGLKPPLEFTLIRPVDVIGSGDFVRGAREGVNRSQPRRHPMHAMEGIDRDALGGDRGLLQDLVPHGVVRKGVLEYKGIE